jgi:beta-ribofuranosylaminobenzene 5'-phosphate synthase
VISITTGRRLHFGLFTPIPVPELDLAFGGVGAMVDVPGITIQGRPAETWSATGACASRVNAILDILQKNHPSREHPAFTLTVTYAAPAHQGWGTGTQLALAVARLWCHVMSLPWSAEQAARWTGRGHRSGSGTVGFDQPGLIVDPGKQVDSMGESRGTARVVTLPPEWAWLLVEPRGEMGLHSGEEQHAFSRLPPPDRSSVHRLRVLAHSLSLAPNNYQHFAETLTDYNRLAGSLYESVQGGIYGSPLTAQRIAHLQSLGAFGVGQSSWGPGIFAVFPSEAAAQDVKARLELPNCSLYLGKTSCTSPKVDSSPAAR